MRHDDPRLLALEPAREDLERALCRDRSHAVVCAPAGADPAFLLRALDAKGPPGLELRSVSLVSVPPEELCSRILRALGRDAGGDAPARLREALAELAERDATLALLVEDAGDLAPATLGALGVLATRAGTALRLMLFVGSAGESEVEAAARVVEWLGVGVQKIALAGAADRAREVSAAAGAAGALSGAEAPAPPAAWAPPGTAARERAGPRRIRVAPPRDGPPRRRPHARALATLGLALGLALGVVGALQVVPEAAERTRDTARDLRERARAPAPQEEAAAPVALAPPAPPPAALPTRAPQPRPEPAAAPAPAPELVSAPAVAPAAPPKRTLPLSLNARPWARIEIDGRDVGLTPLAGVRVAPGPHRFRAYLPDGRVLERRVEVHAGSTHISFP
jgi:hypothetical protein